MLIGITGTFGAGKGSVVDYLVKDHGFRHVSARSVWAAEMNKRDIVIDRDSMTRFASEMRAEHGADYFMRLALSSVINSHEHVVIESVRAIGEAELLHSKKGILLGIDADIALRYKRIYGRATELDKGVSFEDFIAQEGRELENDDPNKQNLKKVMEMSDYKIVNNGTLEELEAETRMFLSAVKKASI